MQKLLTRSAIRSRLRAITGHAGSDAQSGQTSVRHNEFISLAHDDILHRRPWRSTQKEYKGTLGIDQRFMSYPSNSGAGNILEIAIWSNGIDATSGGYIPLRRSSITLTMDTDPISDLGGDAAAAQRSMPTRYHLKEQIEFWPRPEQQYLIKIDHTITSEITQDSDVTLVDGVAVLCLAVAMELDYLGDIKSAQKYEARGERRWREIAGWQDHGEIVSMDEDAIMGRNDEYFGKIDAGLIVDGRRPG